MFEKSTVRIFAMISGILSAFGLLFSIYGTFFLQQLGVTLGFVLGVVTWSLLLWSSILGYKLVADYQLDADEVKKVGIRIYLIILAFILFLTIGLVVGLFLSIYILSGLWGMKKNYDEWEPLPGPMVEEQPRSGATPGPDEGR
jgi:hypothetical protein